MTRHRMTVLATLGHVATLGGAFLFQAIGFAPCAMCLWQRWPHAAGILFGALAIFGIAPRLMVILAGFSALTTSGIGFFHAGVEQKWWDGPSSCTGGGPGLGGLSGADLLNTDIVDKIVMCDDIVWQIGLTMAGWNGVVSLALAGLWFHIARNRF